MMIYFFMDIFIKYWKVRGLVNKHNKNGKTKIVKDAVIPVSKSPLRPCP